MTLDREDIEEHGTPEGVCEAAERKRLIIKGLVCAWVVLCSGVGLGLLISRWL